ncbi:hypothetical protein IEU95_07510 [Hoyosella rhizosphaerae]|uniref:Membrane protein n=1 Tax=Hoyosella rhizosphaerae TaxID=1755582 RepID=A0A916U1V2_9ACTN|nr:hypothetical protein [Hoyosella rhizosphaerae]MBN4926671.1 hypothetical protein [Hoyosella rhizosphaerae]GGC57387.1 membrane protein [Hoyosella rhizosphaerae]
MSHEPDQWPPIGPDPYDTGGQPHQMHPPGQYQPMPPMSPIQPHGYDAPKPGVIPLRPLGVGEILDGAVRTMTKYAATMFGLTAILVTIGQLISLIAQAPTAGTALDPFADPFVDPLDDAAFIGMLGGQFVAGLAAGLVTILLYAMLTFVVSRAVLGQPVSFSDAWAGAKPHLLRIIGLYILSIIVLIAAIAAIVGSFFIHPAVGVVAVLTGLVAGVWIAVLVSVAVPAIVFEQATLIGGIKRSIALVRGTWWRIFGILLLVGVIVLIVTMIVQIPIGIVAGIVGVVVDSPFLILVIGSIGGILSSLIVTPFMTTTLALLYTDLRMRKEGLDIELTRRVSGGEQPRTEPGPSL